VSVVVLLDAGPLGLVTNRSGRSEVNACRRWLASLLDAGTAVHVPAIADYEVRRELLRADKITGLARLDALVDSLGYVPITRQAMLQAAHIWSSARRQGRQTAPDASLDGD